MVATAAAEGAGEDGPLGWPPHEAQPTEVEGCDREHGVTINVVMYVYDMCFRSSRQWCAYLSSRWSPLTG